jgi:4-alpha-glucanotransferase
VSEDLIRLCAAHGIEPRYTGIDGITRDVSIDTLSALAEAFGIADAEPVTLPDIAAVRAEPSPPRCHIPASLAGARVWGLTCQLGSLVSDRNAGIGDYADLAVLCRVAADEGADFVGVNPLHALFWIDPERVSPFFPSNRRFLNPLYIAIDRVDGFAGLTDDEQAALAVARAAPLIDHSAVARLKDRVLRRLFKHFPWTDAARASFLAFRETGGEAMEAHAVYEAIAEKMVGEGAVAVPGGWPEPLRQYGSPEVVAFAEQKRPAVGFHLWLQWISERQLEGVQREARDAGMRVGLYLDVAVGAAPDGSAAWADPTITVPGVSIGAPPDPFSAGGQDWGLAPLSPVRLAELDGLSLARTMAAVMRAHPHPIRACEPTSRGPRRGRTPGCS